LSNYWGLHIHIKDSTLDTTTNNIFALPTKTHGVKPTLVGGDPPARGFKHKVFSLSNHHLYVLAVMAEHYSLGTDKVLANMIQHFIENNREIVDRAFEVKALSNNARLEVKDE